MWPLPSKPAWWRALVLFLRVFLITWGLIVLLSLLGACVVVEGACQVSRAGVICEREGKVLMMAPAHTIEAGSARLTFALDVRDGERSESVDGTAELVEDAELLRVWAVRLGGRYMGAERAEEFGAKNAVPGELLVRVTPSRLVGLAEIAGKPSP